MRVVPSGTCGEGMVEVHAALGPKVDSIEVKDRPPEPSVQPGVLAGQSVVLGRGHKVCNAKDAAEGVEVGDGLIDSSHEGRNH